MDREELERFIVGEFRVVLHREDAAVTRALCDIQLIRNNQRNNYEIELRFEIDNGQPHFCRIQLPRMITVHSENIIQPHHLTTIWWRVFEDQQMEVAQHNIMAEVIELQRNGAPYHAIEAAQRMAEHQIEQIRRNHAVHPIFMVGGEMALELDRSGAVRATSADHARAMARRDRGNMTATEVRTRQTEYTARMLVAAMTAVDPPMMVNALDGWIRPGDGWIRPGEDLKAHERARELLIGGLSVKQRESYEMHKWFIVHGSIGGLYKVHYGRQMNIHKLHPASRKVEHRICFLPTGGLVEEDCMLAQKIALETDEKRALKVANIFAVQNNETRASHRRALRPTDGDGWDG